TPTGFVPNEDRGMIFANIELPAGASLDRTNEVIQELYTRTHNLSGVEGVSFVRGRSLLSGNGSNYAIGFLKLNDWEEREDPSLSTTAITGKLFAIASTVKEANIVFFAPPSISGFGNSAGFEVNLLDRFGGDFTELDTYNKQFMAALAKHPEIQYAQSAFNTNYPKYEMEVNVPLAKQKGAPISSIFSTLQCYIGSVYASSCSGVGNNFRVYIQSLPEDTAAASALTSKYLISDSVQMAPFTQFITLERVYGPQSVTRFHLFNSATISGAINPGY